MLTVYRESAPAAGWDQHIECYWTMTSRLGVMGYPVRPDGCVDILYSPEMGARVVGAMTTKRCFDFPAGARVAGVRFRPGMCRPFLKTLPAEITDLTVPLEEIWGLAGRELKARLDDTRSADERAALIAARLPVPSAPPNPVQRAIRTIAAAHGNVNLDFICRQTNLSPRQFRRRCLEESGLTPKHLCRILRFRRVCALARGNPGEWVGIAAEAGYFDQAHLIRDFREFTGQTPMSVFSNTSSVPEG